MKKILLSIVLLFLASSLKAQDENHIISSLFTHYFFYMIIGIVVTFFIYYHFLRYTFKVEEFKKSLDYNNKLLELLVLKEIVTKEEIEEIRMLATGSDEEVELLQKRQYHRNKA